MRYVLATLLVLILPGCGKQTAIVEINTSVCPVWEPWRWSAKDTDETIALAKRNNARRAEWCSGYK